MNGRKDCVCPRARHQHGTLGAYRADRCRCFACRLEAATARRQVRISTGTWADPHSVVHPCGITRRLEALAAIGWSTSMLAPHLGITQQSVSDLRSTRKYAITATAARVRAVYDALWDKPPPDSPASARARLIATKRGWALPMQWDDDLIDDPDGQPQNPTGGTWDRKPCGTPAAYRRHMRRGEPIDEACRNANRRDTAQRKGAA